MINQKDVEIWDKQYSVSVKPVFDLIPTKKGGVLANDVLKAIGELNAKGKFEINSDDVLNKLLESKYKRYWNVIKEQESTFPALVDYYLKWSRLDHKTRDYIKKIRGKKYIDNQKQ